MVEELAVQAVKLKCGFENAKMTGNYECAYALGVLSAAAGLEKITEYKDLIELGEKVFAATQSFTTEDERLSKMIHILKDYEITDIFDEQMRELYGIGYDDKKL